MSRPRPSVLVAFDPLLNTFGTPKRVTGSTELSRVANEELTMTTFFNRAIHQRPKQRRLRTRLIDVGDTTVDDDLEMIGEDNEGEALIGFDSIELEFEPLANSSLRPQTPPNILQSSTAGMMPSPQAALLTRVPLTILEEEDDNSDERQRLDSSEAFRLPWQSHSNSDQRTPPRSAFGASTAELLPSPKGKMLTRVGNVLPSELGQSMYSSHDIQSSNQGHSMSNTLPTHNNLAMETSFDLLRDRVSFFGKTDSDPRWLATSLGLSILESNEPLESLSELPNESKLQLFTVTLMLMTSQMQRSILLRSAMRAEHLVSPLT